MIIVKSLNTPIARFDSPIVTLPDGFNGHTEIFYSTPIDKIGDTVKLSCASVGKECMIRWVHIDQLKSVVRESQRNVSNKA